MKINLRSAKHSNHEILVFQQNLKGFPLEQVALEEFPITYTLHSVSGEEIPIIIDDKFKVKVKGKRKKHHIKELYQWLYGIDTQEGKDKAFSYETSSFGAYDETPDLIPSDTSSLPEEHSPFSVTYTYNSVKAQWNSFLNTVRYHSMSPNGHSVAIKDYHIHSDRAHWDIKGVFRLHQNVFDTSKSIVMVVDTPLIADYLNSNGIAAIALPSEEELPSYTFGKILAGKSVYFCTQMYGANYSFSVYPFASLLLKHNIDVFITNHLKAFNQQSIPDWYQNTDQSKLLDALQQNSQSIFPSDIPSRKYYDHLISDDIYTRFHPAQDYIKQSLVYATNTGDVAFSKPFRVFSLDEAPRYEGVKPYSKNRTPDSNLTPFILEKIQHGDHLDSSATYLNLRKFLKRFIYFKHESYFDILASWILLTYVFRVFKAFPYVHLVGQRGTGKSTVLELVSKLAFNGFFQTKATIPTSVEMAHTHSSTLCIDEFEDYSGRRKSHDELSKFLNSGYNYTGTFTKKVGATSTTFYTYSPKIFGGTGNIELDTLKSRTIPIKTIKKPDSLFKEQFLEFDYQNISDINLLKTSMYAFGLNEAHKIYSLSLTDFTQITLPISKRRLNNRQLELSRPLLTLAAFLDNEKLESTLLTGLNRCWYPSKSYKSEQDEKLYQLLYNYFDQTDELEPKEKQKGYKVYDAKALFSHPSIRKFVDSQDNLGKQKFNTLISDLFDIQRTEDIYIPDLQKNPSCYLVPASFFE